VINGGYIDNKMVASGGGGWSLQWDDYKMVVTRR